MTAVDERVNGKGPAFFGSGLMALEHRWSKCITLEGNYIEKEEVEHWLILLQTERSKYAFLALLSAIGLRYI